MTGQLGRRIARAVVGVLRNAVVAVAAQALLLTVLLGVALVPLAGLGVPVLVETLGLVRRCASAQRRWAEARLGAPLTDPYPPWPEGPFRIRALALARQPTTGRDLGWLAWQALAGPVLLLGVAIPVVVAVTLALAPDSGWQYVVLALPALAALGFAGLVTIPLDLAHALVSRWWLAVRGERTSAAARITELTETRTRSVDARAAELRQIERDLHDGVQARLVSLGMSVGLARAEVRRAPDHAEELLDEVRADVGATLDELRALVRGIHPPVLAERGLPDALEALAAGAAAPVRTAIEPDARTEPAVESALYFAAAELLTNVSRHAGAASASLVLGRLPHGLRLAVGDDGCGGADPATGTGLRGVRDRIAAFDGTVVVHSPAGGPTEISMEVPCTPSSPRTRPCSGTG